MLFCYSPCYFVATVLDFPLDGEANRVGFAILVDLVETFLLWYSQSDVGELVTFSDKLQQLFDWSIAFHLCKYIQFIDSTGLYNIIFHYWQIWTVKPLYKLLKALIILCLHIVVLFFLKTKLLCANIIPLKKPKGRKSFDPWEWS